MASIPVTVDQIWLVVALPFVGFLVNGWLSFYRPQAKTAVSAVGVGVLVVSFVLAALIIGSAADGMGPDGYVVHLWSWIPVGALEIDVALQLDQLSAVMLLVVTGVGTLIHIFSIGYMREDPSYPRYFAYLNLFVFFMLVLVLGSNFPVLFVGWEGVGLCSYLLIGFWFSDKANADAGKKAFVMNRIGDVGLLIAMFLIYRETGSLGFREVFDAAPAAFSVGGPVITLITLFLFLGCIGKSAQIPLYTWLPDAMAGPTPVSALIHAATMVTAGVYLVARSGVLFAMAPVSGAVVTLIGAVTALFAATIALKQWDIKKVLAYSTVSQLGYMFMGVGMGAYAAGMFHLVTHAFFKALLFLGSGSVIYAMHHAYHHTHNDADPQDMRNMGGLRQHMPWTAGMMWIATLAIAGIPPLSGFFSKDGILAVAFGRAFDHDQGSALFLIVWLLGTVTAFLTAFYMARMMLYTFEGPNRSGEAETRHLHEAPWTMTGPLLALGALALVGGLLNLPEVLPGAGFLEHWLEPVTEAAAPYLFEIHLSAATEWMLLGGATVIAIIGIGLAYAKLVPSDLETAAEAEDETGFQRVLRDKYYVDELYDAAVVQPIVSVSRSTLWKRVDAGLIDGLLVNGSARLAKLLGFLGTWLQTGSAGLYLGMFVIGALVLLRMMVGG